MDDVTLRIENGALLDVPIFEHDECGRNWLAIIDDIDIRFPGGFKRRFCPRAGHPFFYLIGEIEPGQVIEFGADRVSMKHPDRKQPKRVYGLVKSVTAEALVYTPQPHPLTALAMQSALGRQRPEKG